MLSDDPGWGSISAVAYPKSVFTYRQEMAFKLTVDIVHAISFVNCWLGHSSTGDLAGALHCYGSPRALGTGTRATFGLSSFRFQIGAHFLLKIVFYSVVLVGVERFERSSL